MTGVPPAALICVITLTALSIDAQTLLLTMPRVKAAVASQKNVFKALEADPALAARFRAAAPKVKRIQDANGSPSLSTAVMKMVASEPKLADAYTKAGTTPKEVEAIFEALTECLLEDSMPDQAKAKTQNVTFLRNHSREIELLLKDYSASMAKSAEVADALVQQ
jgi:hypothetical protein